MDVPAPPRKVVGGVRRILEQGFEDWRRKPHIVAPFLFGIFSLLLVAIEVFSPTGWTGLAEVRLPQLVQAFVPLVILCLGSGLVIATGQIDLSSSATAAFSGVVFAALVTSGWPGTWALAGAIIVGWGVGLANGYLVSYVGAPSLIVTWATGLVLTIASVLLSVGVGGREANGGLPFDMPDGAFALGAAGFASFLGCAIFALALVTSTNLSREAMAVGADSQSALYIGIQPRTVRMRSFVLAGILSSFAGVLSCYSLASARTTDLQGNSLVVVAICVLGGTLLSGGYYSALSIMFAAVVWSELELIVPAVRLPFVPDGAEAQLIQVAFGLVVLGAVLAFARQLRGHLRPVLTMPTVES